MSRREFTAATQRAAWKRSDERCEAEGEIYGLPPGVRCNADLNLGVEYDHVDPDKNSKDNSLENCCAACPKCHRWKTNKRDRPLLAKTDHQEDMRRGVRRRPKHNWGKRPMSGHGNNARDIHADLETTGD